MPIVSVVIPCFNHGKYLPEAVESARSQSLHDLEIIIINDGSTDPETLEILTEYARQGLDVLHTENQGLAAARNHGIRHARGKYILPLDADDRIAPRYLESAIRVLDDDPAVGIVYGLVEFFGERQGAWLQPDFSLPHLLYENMIVAAAVFRKADWERVGGYRESMRHGWEDWDFWLSLVGSSCSVVRISEVVLYYRIRSDSMTRSLSSLRKIGMFLHLAMNHPRLYVVNFPVVVRGLTSCVLRAWR